MKIGIPIEIKPGERRVALVPESVKRLVSAGFEVLVEKGAGRGAFYADEEYGSSGAKVVPGPGELYGSSNIVIKIHRPLYNDRLKKDETALIGKGAVIISLLYPLYHIETIKKIKEAGLTAFALDLMPRVAAAQSMDVLSSMATIAGYKAVLMAAERLPRLMPMLMTAAGTVPPARVLVIGAGVAGLQACATARRLGGVVEAFDQRPAVKEQVESLGARFIEVPTEEETESAGGYAMELSDDYKRRQAGLLKEHISRADAVITTALMPGKRAPLLITEEMVQSMRPGSVIVDLASDFGGNCALTDAGKVVERHGVAVCGFTDVPGLIPYDASRMYSRNVERFVLHMADKDGLKLDSPDDILRGTLVVREGVVVNKAVSEALERQGAP